eukprot:6904273-Lingulodinium_polyedra.AAC.1
MFPAVNRYSDVPLFVAGVICVGKVGARWYQSKLSMNPRPFSDPNGASRARRRVQCVEGRGV